MFYKFVCAILKVFCAIAFDLKLEGGENIPEEGALILAPNHRSYYDPIMAGIICKRPIRFMAKSELFENKLFGALITKLGAFPLQRGRGDVAAVKAAFSILKEGNVLLMFPQGKRIKDGTRGKLKTGVAVIAHKMQVPVVPVCISGEFKFRHKVTVSCGKPIYFEEYYGQKLDEDSTNIIAEKVYDGIFELQQQ